MKKIVLSIISLFLCLPMTSLAKDKQEKTTSGVMAVVVVACLGIVNHEKIKEVAKGSGEKLNDLCENNPKCAAVKSYFAQFLSRKSSISESSQDKEDTKKA